MRAIGIICEFNPFHEGHAYLLRRAREAVGAEGCVICAMSGRFVQRGTAAMLDPYLRGEMALTGGADLALELPFPWSAGSAEHFARAGVEILTACGVDSLIFGSESGDAALLQRAAAVPDDPAFGETYASLCRSGMGTTAAYAAAIRARLGDRPLPDSFPASNDFLGIAYLQALGRLRTATGRAPDALVIRREGAGYREDTVAAEGYPSATALRRVISEAACDPIALNAILAGTMPSGVQKALLDAIERGDAPLAGDRLLPFFHAYYRLQTPGAIEGYAECGGGLSAHICRRARETATPEVFLAALRTKQYTDARLRRAMLYAACGVTADDLQRAPSHTTLLAATRRGCDHLKVWQKANRDNPHFTIVTKPADAPASRQTDLGVLADALFTLCFSTPREAGELIRRSPVIQ